MTEFKALATLRFGSHIVPLAIFLSVFSFLALSAAERTDFAHDVQPLLAARCGACHGGDKRSGGFTIREYNEMLRGGRSGASVIPGDPRGSLLLERVNGGSGPQMPLGGAPLNAKELHVIEAWIADGARLTYESAAARTPWAPKLQLTAPPVPSGMTMSPHPIDRIIDANSMVRVVGDAAFARRAYLDVWGLLPSPEALEKFVQSRDRGKREKLIDHLLADNRNYAGHWISFWNDLLRNDGGDSYHGGRKSITDWLSTALESNLPYDQFVTALLSPGQTGAPDGFLLGVNWRGDINASQTPVMQAAQNSAQVFLGINLKCNSCHDSFISHWKLKDAYGLAAYFAESPKLELVRCDNPTGQFATPGFLYPELNVPATSESLADRRAAAARMFTDPRNGRTPRTLVNRYWARLLGRGIVQDVDDMDGEPWNPQLLDWLASDFLAHGQDLKHLLRTIMTSRAYQMAVVRRASSDDKEYVFRGPELRRITAEEFIDAIGAITGEWEVAPQPGTRTARYSRDWRMPSSYLSRALGRPVRDQVFTQRDESPTTLQALELVNGGLLTRVMLRGAERLLGKRAPAPANLFDSGQLSSQHVAVDVDISKASELRLLVADVGSYSPERVAPVWADAQVEKDGVWIPLDGAVPGAVQMKGAAYSSGLRMAAPAEKIYDIRGRGFTRFRAVAGVEEQCLQSDISPSVRFFVFGAKPDWERLVRVEADPPLPPPARTSDLTRQLWMHALGREPTAAERRLARDSLHDPSSLADLLWSLMMLPEFQWIG